MTDTITIRDSAGLNVPVSVDDLDTLNGVPVTDVHIQRFKAVFGSDGAGQDVDAAHPLPVTVANLPATQPVSAALAAPVATRLSDGTSAIGSTAQRLWVDDGGQSLTVDSPALDTLHADLGHLTDGTAQVKFVAPAGSTTANVAASITTGTLAAANAARRGLYVFNDSTANLFLKLGATASTSSFTVKIPAGGLYELPVPFYRGVVDGIWDAANGNARVTELS